MSRRCFDFAVALLGLAVMSPALVVIAVLISSYDRKSPFYIAPRAARGNATFRMVKFRSMTAGADKSGVNSTAANDSRITPVGRFVRAWKLDELPQLWNVLQGDMSLVGPRPQVKSDADLYTDMERKLLSVRPGITDPASIVFSDEGAILQGSADPDLLYNQIIRPWKSRLALLYVDHQSLGADLRIILLTVLAIVSKPMALRALLPMLTQWGADELVCAMASRTQPLRPWPPPGAATVVTLTR
jgi:lipopolysaccharide/colanic/teichoic acid biosynthesis glycosyltransferase